MRAADILLQDNELEYETHLGLPGAYKALKMLVHKPPIVHSKKPNANYMKQTFSTSRHAVMSKKQEHRFLELSRMTKSKGSKMSQQSSIASATKEDLRLPPLMQKRNQGLSDMSTSSVKKNNKQEKVDKKIEFLLEAYRNKDLEQVNENQPNSHALPDPKKNLRDKYGFSDSEHDE